VPRDLHPSSRLAGQGGGGGSDGDTVTVLDAEGYQHKVRLAGIDAPERAQPFGQALNISLSDQIFAREVAVRAARAGLWHDDKPVPPWEWLHKK
jgi:endonuclease YncB( thermonuclease family)